MSLNFLVLASTSALILSQPTITAPDHCGQVDQLMRYYNLGTANPCEVEKRMSRQICRHLMDFPVLYLRNSVYKTNADAIRDKRLLDIQNARFNVRLFLSMKNYCPTRLGEY